MGPLAKAGRDVEVVSREVTLLGSVLHLRPGDLVVVDDDHCDAVGEGTFERSSFAARSMGVDWLTVEKIDGGGSAPRSKKASFESLT